MKQLLILLLFLSAVSTAQSQQFDIQAGIRSGFSNGLTCRILTGQDTYSEAMLLSRNQGVQLYVLKGITFPAPKIPVKGFTFSTAWGAHLGFTGSKIRHDEYYFERNRMMPVLGLDYYLSLNYTIAKFPITLSVDYKPFAEIVPDRILRINMWDFGFTLRYQFTTKI